MSEENKSAEEIPQNIIEKPMPGQAILAVRIDCAASGPGVNLGLDVRIIAPKWDDAPNIPSLYLTLAARNCAEVLRNAVKDMCNNPELFKPALRDADETFVKFANEKCAKDNAEADAGETPATPTDDANDATPREVPHGV